MYERFKFQTIVDEQEGYIREQKKTENVTTSIKSQNRQLI